MGIEVCSSLTGNEQSECKNKGAVPDCSRNMYPPCRATGTRHAPPATYHHFTFILSISTAHRLDINLSTTPSTSTFLRSYVESQQKLTFAFLNLSSMSTGN